MMTLTDFNELASIYHPRLVRTAVKRWGDEGEDVVQEAFLRALENIESFRHDSSFPTWVFGICLNIKADANKTLLPVDDNVDVLKILDTSPTPEEKFSYNQIIALCEKLPRQQRESIFNRLNGEETDRKNLWWAKQVLSGLLGIDDGK
jgi:RNA polymerase sigma factor (sigma-70 family)